MEKQIWHTRVVLLEEVRADVARWTPPFKKEGVRKFDLRTAQGRQKMEQCKRAGDVMEMLPLKAVATEKPSKGALGCLQQLLHHGA